MLTNHQPRMTEEIVRLGSDLIKRMIEPTLPPSDIGRFICVDVDRGAYEIDDDDVAAIERLHARFPESDSFLGRVGEDTTYRMSPR
jgi:hypothetical protein